MTASFVLAVAGAKGGVGKTTTSINLGKALAQEGRETLVVELDLAMANMVDFLSFPDDPDPTLHEVLAGEADPIDAVYDVGDHTSVAPSGTTLDGFASTDLDRFPAVMERYGEIFDVLIVDTGAGLNRSVVEPIRAADATVVVSTPRVASVRDAKKTIALSERVETPVCGLVLAQSGTGASPGPETIADFLDVDLLGHIPDDDAVPASQDKGKPVVEWAPQSSAGITYRETAENVLAELSATEADAGEPDRSGPDSRREEAGESAAIDRSSPPADGTPEADEAAEPDPVVSRADDSRTADTPGGQAGPAPDPGGVDRGDAGADVGEFDPDSDPEPAGEERSRDAEAGAGEPADQGRDGSGESEPEPTAAGHRETPESPAAGADDDAAGEQPGDGEPPEPTAQIRRGGESPPAEPSAADPDPMAEADPGSASDGATDDGEESATASDSGEPPASEQPDEREPETPAGQGAAARQSVEESSPDAPADPDAVDETPESEGDDREPAAGTDRASDDEEPGDGARRAAETAPETDDTSGEREEDAETDVAGEAGAESDADSEADDDIEPDTDSEADDDVEPVAGSETDDDSEVDVDVEPDADSGTDDDVEPDADSETDGDSEADVDDEGTGSEEESKSLVGRLRSLLG